MDLIRVEEKEGKQLVSARELHKFLEVGRDFTTWVKNRIEKYDFEENVDFTVVSSVPQNGGIVYDFIITLDMAKELSMVENNAKGRNARKHFIAVEKAWNDPMMIMKRANEIANRKMVEYKELASGYKKQIEVNKPKVVFADSIEVSKSSLLIGELAKLISQSTGNKIGQNILFQWLRDNGYLMKRHGSDYNMPTQKSMNLGVLKIKEGTRFNNGVSHITKTPKVTGKGQIYFINKFKEAA